MATSYEERQARFKAMHETMQEVSSLLNAKYNKLYDHYGEIIGSDFVVDCCLYNDCSKYTFRASNKRKLSSSNLCSRNEPVTLEIGASIKKTAKQLVQDINKRLLETAKDVFLRAERHHQETVDRSQANKRTAELLSLVTGLDKYNGFDNLFGGNVGNDTYIKIRTSINGGIERFEITSHIDDDKAMRILQVLSQL